MVNNSLSFRSPCPNLRLMRLAFSVGFFLLCSSGLCKAGESEKEIVLRGSVICVDETRSEVSCESDNRLFALKVADGRKFIFDPDDSNSRIFKDKRLHARELQVKAWDRGADRLEVIKVYSIKDGQLFDIHYFCQTCNITAFVGGLCWCCQEEFEFRETPVGPALRPSPLER